MKKIICVLSVILSAAYSLYYASLGGFKEGNSGALSKIGLSHPLLFIIWGALTFFALCCNITYGYSKTKYTFYRYLLILSEIGMILTLFFHFDYAERTQYFIHCTGSLTFSVVTGITVLLLFALSKKYVLSIICGAVLVSDFILLLIFKETALIELFPIFSGYIMLLIYNLRKERDPLEIK